MNEKLSDNPFDKLRRIFSGKIPSRPQESVGRSKQPITPAEIAGALTHIFLAAEKLLTDEFIQTARRDETGKIVIPVTPEGGVDAKFMKELITSRESLELSDAKVGDVVWWKDEEGRTGCFLVTEEYVKGKPGIAGTAKSGKGVLKLETEEELIQECNASIWGATLGGMLWKHKIGKNLRIAYALPYDRGPYDGAYLTEPVEAMGIIKGNKLSLDKALLEAAKQPDDPREHVRITPKDELAISFYEQKIEKDTISDALIGGVLKLPIEKIYRNLAGYGIRESKGRTGLIAWGPDFYLGHKGRPMIYFWKYANADNYGAVALAYGTRFALKFRVQDYEGEERNVYLVPYLHFHEEAENEDKIAGATLITMDQGEFEDIQQVLKSILPSETFFGK